MLKLSHAHYAALRRHGEETYPQECCGVLLGGANDDGTRVVTSTARCGNTRTDSPQNRYHIDPRELIRIQREGRERGEEVGDGASGAESDAVAVGHEQRRRFRGAGRTLSASTTPTPTTRRAGPKPISPKPTGLAAPTSSPAWRREKHR